MSNHTKTCCDICDKEIPAAVVIHFSPNVRIGSTSFKPGDYCISCLAEMCGEELMTPEKQRTLKALEEERWRRINEERRATKDW